MEMEVLPEGTCAPIKKGPGLYEFLMEAELAHYFNSFKNNLKVTHPSQLKFATDEDLIDLGMSKPELRRMRKYYDKHFANNYLTKFKKLLTTRKQHQLNDGFGGCVSTGTGAYSPDSRGEYMRASGDVRGSGDGSAAGGKRVPNKHIISPANITVNKELGMGEFGVVQQGVWCNEGERIQVAIKCLVRERMQTNTIEFLKEAVIMHSIDHPHIVRLFGVVLDMGSLMLVTELAPLRSLLECLKEPSVRSSFPVMTLADFAVQICDGMQYLEVKRFIHRDLAARNILVFSKNTVKISDFGLSRALGQGKDYYQTNFNVNLKLPIAWCAPECISYLRFTTASDVWAYGVTLWEMFSYGFQPWAALTGQQILEAIDDPHFQRLEQPDCCPREYYALMLDCWRHEPAQRPRFSEIAAHRLLDCRPEQVQAKVTLVSGGAGCSGGSLSGPGDTQIMIGYRVGDVITVLDKLSHRPLWKGIAPTAKSGLFDPTNFISYLGPDLPSLQSSISSSCHQQHHSNSSAHSHSTGMATQLGGLLSGVGGGSLLRSSIRRSKLRSEMISGPTGEVKHTGHVGLDGAYFGDICFLSGGSGSTNGGAKLEYGTSIPTQIVPPYRPTSTDFHHHQHQLQHIHHQHIQQDSTPLIDPHNPSPVSDHHHQHQFHHQQHTFHHEQHARQHRHHSGASASSTITASAEDFDHEYHEISDEEDDMGTGLGGSGGNGSPDLDLGPSLMAEMEMMFSSLGGPPPPPSPADHDGSNKTNELREKLNSAGNCSERGGGTLTKSTVKTNKMAATVKPISAQDSKTLETAIAIANEMSTTRPKSSAHHHSSSSHYHHGGAANVHQQQQQQHGFISSSHHHHYQGGAPGTPTSPGGVNNSNGSGGGKRKFSFRFPSAGSSSNSNAVGAGNGPNGGTSVVSGGASIGGGVMLGDGELRMSRGGGGFAEEAQSTPDLQHRRCLRASLSSLDKIPPSPNSTHNHPHTTNNVLHPLPLWDKVSAEFCFAKSRDLLTKPFPPPPPPPQNHQTTHILQLQSATIDSSSHHQKMPLYASCRDLHQAHAHSIDDPYVREVQNRRRVLLFDQPAVESRRAEYYNNQPAKQDMLICEDDHDLYPSQLYRNRMYTQSENMSRKVYYTSRDNRFIDQQQQMMMLHDARPPPPSPFNSRTDDYQPNVLLNQQQQRIDDNESYTPIETYDNVFMYEPTPPIGSPTPSKKPSSTSRTRATSFSRAESCDTATVRRSSGRSVRDRNRRRQSYNPRAYLAASSSSEEEDEDSVSADCTSLGSVDFGVDWRRRKRLSRLSASNSSIRSEMIARSSRVIDAGSPAPSLGSVRVMNGGTTKAAAITSDHKGAIEKGDKMVESKVLLQGPDLVGMLVKTGFGRSPPPSSNVLSGLSPTSVSRLLVGGSGGGESGGGGGGMGERMVGSGGSGTSDSSL